jgi:hypothetical protein
MFDSVAMMFLTYFYWKYIKKIFLILAYQNDQNIQRIN